MQLKYNDRLKDTLTVGDKTYHGGEVFDVDDESGNGLLADPHVNVVLATRDDAVEALRETLLRENRHELDDIAVSLKIDPTRFDTKAEIVDEIINVNQPPVDADAGQNTQGA